MLGIHVFHPKAKLETHPFCQGAYCCFRSLWCLWAVTGIFRLLLNLLSCSFMVGGSTLNNHEKSQPCVWDYSECLCDPKKLLSRRELVIQATILVSNISGHFECPPYNQQTIRSAYHVRNIEVFKLKQVSEKPIF